MRRAVGHTRRSAETLVVERGGEADDVTRVTRVRGRGGRGERAAHVSSCLFTWSDTTPSRDFLAVCRRCHCSRLVANVKISTPIEFMIFLSVVHSDQANLMQNLMQEKKPHLQNLDGKWGSSLTLGLQHGFCVELSLLTPRQKISHIFIHLTLSYESSTAQHCQQKFNSITKLSVNLEQL